MKLLFLIVLFTALSATVATAAPVDPFGRGALRSVITACKVSKAALGLSFPCADVRSDSPTAEGYAVIRSPGLPSEYVLSPLADYDGIESPGLQEERATGLWATAWAMQDKVAEALGRPLAHDQLALAVNASGTRTQDHFHIHLDCLRTSVGKALQAQRRHISDRWALLRTPLRGSKYWARRIASSDLAGINVAQLVAEAPPAREHAMGRVSLAVVGRTLANGSDGFYLLANWNNVSAERLLDHQCR